MYTNFQRYNPHICKVEIFMLNRQINKLILLGLVFCTLLNTQVTVSDSDISNDSQTTQSIPGKSFSRVTFSNVLSYKKGIGAIIAVTAFLTLLRKAVPFGQNTNKRQLEELEKNPTATACVSRDNPLKTPLILVNYDTQSHVDTLKSHGFGMHAMNYLRAGSLSSTMRYTIPCFEEAEKDRFLMTSLGGNGDTNAILVALHKIIKNNPSSDDLENEKQIIIEGVSRGCDPVIKALAKLNNSRNEGIAWLNITDTDCQEILNRVEKGYMILTVPMKSRAAVLKHISGGYIGTSVNLVSLPAATGSRCTPFDKQAIDCIKDLKGLYIPTAVFFAQRDEVVGNTLDERYVTELQEAMGDECITSNTILHCGHNSIHNKTDYITKKDKFISRVVALQD